MVKVALLELWLTLENQQATSIDPICLSFILVAFKTVCRAKPLRGLGAARAERMFLARPDRLLATGTSRRRRGTARYVLQEVRV